MSLLSHPEQLRHPGSDSDSLCPEKHAYCRTVAKIFDLRSNCEGVLHLHQEKLMLIVFTLCVITGYMLGHRIATYLEV